MPLLDHQWVEATLPVDMGGMGLRSAVNHAPGAFTASLSASSEIMEEVTGKPMDMAEKVDDGMLDLLNALGGEAEELTAESALITPQKVFSSRVDQHTAKQLQDLLVQERDKARLNSLSMQGAGDWLKAVPGRALGLHLRPK